MNGDPFRIIDCIVNYEAHALQKQEDRITNCRIPRVGVNCEVKLSSFLPFQIIDILGISTHRIIFLVHSCDNSIPSLINCQNRRLLRNRENWKTGNILVFLNPSQNNLMVIFSVFLSRLRDPKCAVSLLYMETRPSQVCKGWGKVL